MGGAWAGREEYALGGGLLLLLDAAVDVLLALDDFEVNLVLPRVI